jgi:hypothetical protein
VTRDQLEHAIRAACDVAADTEVIVFGSQAILAQWPDAPAVLRVSIEADIVPKNHPDRVDQIDGVLGELSAFHQLHGFYGHGVPLETVKLPTGWERRAVRIRNANTRNTTGASRMRCVHNVATQLCHRPTSVPKSCPLNDRRTWSANSRTCRWWTPAYAINR